MLHTRELPQSLLLESVKAPNVDCKNYSQPLPLLGAGDMIIDTVSPMLATLPDDIGVPMLLLTLIE